MRLRGLGLAQRLSSRRPHGPGQLMGAREGGKEGRPWEDLVGGIPSSAPGFTWLCVQGAVKAEVGRGGVGKEKAQRGSEREEPCQGEQGKALVGGREPKHPTHPRPCRLPSLLAEGSARGLQNQRRPELTRTALRPRNPILQGRKETQRGAGACWRPHTWVVPWLAWTPLSPRQGAGSKAPEKAVT